MTDTMTLEQVLFEARLVANNGCVSITRKNCTEWADAIDAAIKQRDQGANSPLRGWIFDKLAEALEHTARHRAATEGIDPDQWRVVLFKWEALALQAHAAEAAQAQAAEPVRQFRVVPKGSVWTDVKDPEIWASVTAHPESYETRVLYTHPQPAQDAKLPSDEDFRLHLGELTSAELRVAQAAFRFAMAKESGQ